MNTRTLLAALLAILACACDKSAKEADTKGVATVLPEVVDEVKVVRLDSQIQKPLLFTEQFAG